MFGDTLCRGGRISLDCSCSALKMRDLHLCTLAAKFFQTCCFYFHILHIYTYICVCIYVMYICIDKYLLHYIFQGVSSTV